MAVFVLLFLTLSVFGSFAGLSSTLFPSLSLWEGLKADFESHSHLFLKLRGLHPLLAVVFVYFMLNKKIKGHFFKDFIKNHWFFGD